MRVTSSSVASLVVLLAAAAGPPTAAEAGDLSKLDPPSRQRALAGSGWSRVIVRANDPTATGLDSAISTVGGRPGRALGVIAARVADVPNGKLAALAANPRVARISLDRLALGSLERTGMTVGATTVRQNLGLDGSGVGQRRAVSGAGSRRGQAAGEVVLEPDGEGARRGIERSIHSG